MSVLYKQSVIFFVLYTKLLFLSNKLKDPVVLIASRTASLNPKGLLTARKIQSPFIISNKS